MLFSTIPEKVGDHEAETEVDVYGGHGNGWMNGSRLFGFNWFISGYFFSY